MATPAPRTGQPPLRPGPGPRPWAGSARGEAPRFVSRLLAALLLLASLLAVPAHAVAPDEILANPALEARARDLSRNLRCLVCQNQSIDDSDAPLARDLRLLVRERLSQGDSDAAVIAFVVARYGTFVLLRPPVQTNTILLWLAPLVLLLGAIVGFRRHLPGWAGGGTTTAPSAPAELTAEEAKRLDSLLAPPTAREAGRSLEKPADRT